MGWVKANVYDETVQSEAWAQSSSKEGKTKIDEWDEMTDKIL